MGSQVSMTFSEFIELILARLYDLERDAADGALFDVNAIARELKSSVPTHWIFDAGKVLESRGWAQVAFTFGGGCHARLTGEGRLYVEEERGTGIIHRYRQAPTQFVTVSGTGNQVVIGDTAGAISPRTSIEIERAPALELLQQLRETLRQDPSLSASEREDRLGDADAIEQQVRRREPNRAAVAALLEPLSRIGSISGLVADLIRLFNP